MPCFANVVEDGRPMMSSLIAQALGEYFPHASITETATTSGCPVVRLEFRPGEAFNVTITRARNV